MIKQNYSALVSMKMPLQGEVCEVQYSQDSLIGTWLSLVEVPVLFFSV